MKWDKNKAVEPPYDPMTGILYLGVFVALSIIQPSIESDAVWWFAEILKWLAVALCVLVISRLTLNTLGYRHYVT